MIIKQKYIFFCKNFIYYYIYTHKHIYAHIHTIKLYCENTNISFQNCLNFIDIFHTLPPLFFSYLFEVPRCRRGFSKQKQNKHTHQLILVCVFLHAFICSYKACISFLFQTSVFILN